MIFSAQLTHSLPPNRYQSADGRLHDYREPQWGLDNCFAPHIIYLANSSGIKVGITRKSNIPSRWIDQGAVAALPILEVLLRVMPTLMPDEFAK
jgi:hypothetical protein